MTDTPALATGTRVTVIANTALGEGNEFGSRFIIGMTGVVAQITTHNGHRTYNIMFDSPINSRHLWFHDTEIAPILTNIVVGSRVRTLSNLANGHAHTGVSRGMTGTVRSTTNSRYGVELDLPFMGGHSLGGVIGTTRGLFFSLEGELELIDNNMPIAAGNTPITPTISNISVPAPVRRLRVRIEHRPEINTWQLYIDNGPEGWEDQVAEVLKPYIPREFSRRILTVTWRRRLKRFVDVCITSNGLDPNLLVTAITQWALAKMARDNQGVFQAEIDMNEQNNALSEAIISAPALMAIGNMVYSLTPQGAIKGSRGMALIRKRIVERSNREAAAIRSAAAEEARGIISNAEMRLAEVREQIDRENSVANMRLPEWIITSQVPVIPSGRVDYPWMVGITVHLQIDRFSKLHTRADGVECTYYWNVPDRVKNASATIQLWMPINLSTGSFKYGGTTDGCRLVGTDRNLPHIRYSGCCMTLQGMPDICDNYRKLEQIKQIIERGMKEVNLSSLLSIKFNVWHWAIQNQTPEVIRQYLLNQTIETSNAMYAGATEIVPIDRTAAETFNEGILTNAIRDDDRAIADFVDGLAELAEAIQPGEVDG